MYRVLVADPPWAFKDTLPGPKRGAEKHYPVMKTEDICKMALPPMADDCVLFLWRVASMQQDALDVMKAWGFKLKTEIVWLKKTKTGKRHFGMGRIVRAEHEVCLVGTFGKPQIRPTSKNIRSTFSTEEEEGAFEAEAVRRHSAKPETFYEIVEDLYEGPYFEMFARQRLVGWDADGLEVDRKVW